MDADIFRLFGFNKLTIIATVTSLLILSILYEILVYFIGLIPGKFYKILIQKDKSAFVQQIILSIAIILGKIFN